MGSCGGGSDVPQELCCAHRGLSPELPPSLSPPAPSPFSVLRSPWPREVHLQGVSHSCCFLKLFFPPELFGELEKVEHLSLLRTSCLGQLPPSREQGSTVGVVICGDGGAMGTRGAVWGPPNCSKAHRDQGPSLQKMPNVTLLPWCPMPAPCPASHKGWEAAVVCPKFTSCDVSRRSLFLWCVTGLPSALKLWEEQSFLSHYSS